MADKVYEVDLTARKADDMLSDMKKYRKSAAHESTQMGVLGFLITALGVLATACATPAGAVIYGITTTSAGVLSGLIGLKDGKIDGILDKAIDQLNEVVGFHARGYKYVKVRITTEEYWIDPYDVVLPVKIVIMGISKNGTDWQMFQ